MKKISVSALAFVTILLAAGCGKEDNKGAQEAPITSMQDIVKAPDKRALVGKRVEISDAVVRKVVGNYIFWAGDRFNSVPVARKDKYEGSGNRPVSPNERVSVSGTVRLINETVGPTEWIWDKINAAEKREIEAAGVYIVGDRITHQ